MDSIVAALREYFLQCPLLGDYFLNVDYLPEKPGAAGLEFSLDTCPTATVLRQYASGSLRQYQFAMRLMSHYGPDQVQNADNSGLFEKLAQWLRQQTVRGKLPQLPAGMHALKMEALSTGYLFSAGTDSGKYQIQCALEYYQEGMKLDG